MLVQEFLSEQIKPWNKQFVNQTFCTKICENHATAVNCLPWIGKQNIITVWTSWTFVFLPFLYVSTHIRKLHGFIYTKWTSRNVSLSKCKYNCSEVDARASNRLIMSGIQILGNKCLETNFLK